MRCNDCRKEISEKDAAGYMKIDSFDIIQDYKSVICKDCLRKRKR